MKALRWILLLIAACSTGRLVAQGSGDMPFNGSITDTQGKGIKARIEIKNTGLYTQSDRAGRFGFTRVVPGDTLTVRYRKQTVEIPVAGRRSLKIVWLDTGQPRYSEAPELIDYGYGYVKRRESAVGGTSGISGEAIRRRGYTDLRKAISSMVPGVRVVNGKFILRGGSSVNSAQGAMILLDGTPISNIDLVNINDVESIEVDKDGTMYGMRGSNGVISIRTRSN